MAQPTVKTVQYLDPRIEPQPDPVYDYVIAPIQNQYYKIPASAKSDSMLGFNNLTTLGEDRAYLDTFELELTAQITFTANDATQFADTEFTARPDQWTFDSFPFNKCCSQARVNINGGGFYSQPMCYLRAKERYMNQAELSKCYENVCPVHRPILQTESGRPYDDDMCQFYDLNRYYDAAMYRVRNASATFAQSPVAQWWGRALSIPTRLGKGQNWTMQSDQNMIGGYNNQILKLGKPIDDGDANYFGYANYKGGKGGKKGETVVTVTWREPVFCSPFSSKYDATYGRPLYNITSMDLTFDMPTLKPMIRFVNDSVSKRIKSYSITILSAQLCYQVMTIPKTIEKPLTTLVPYRRFVPYVTDYPGQKDITGAAEPNRVIQDGQEVYVRSGVYTLNEIPTAIWMFLGPTQAVLQNGDLGDTKPNAKNYHTGADACDAPANANAKGITGAENVVSVDSWDNNRLFSYLKHVDITMANTTQILNTAAQLDLYRIAKANGCEDSFWSWSGIDTVSPKDVITNEEMLAATTDATQASYPKHLCDASSIKTNWYGAGSVLRLKPGVDLIVPDQALIPGANARNMVFQADATFVVPPSSNSFAQYAFWLLFEYVGVAAISPGQCEITMNPLGGGEVMSSSPVMSATSQATEGTLEGSGFWDVVKRAAGIAGQIANSGIISRLLKLIPNDTAKELGEKLGEKGYGEPTSKRKRCCGDSCGGAVIGRGLNDWV